MSTTYTLNVTNNSTQFQDLCIYQKPVDLGVPNAMSLAWLTAPAWPGTTVTFTWELNYCFVWSQVGSLKPGVTFQAQQTLPADPNNLNQNQILFDYRQDAFLFAPGNTAGTAQLGSLYVRQLPNVPTQTGTVGIGMSGSGVFAVEAQPNINLVFTPTPSYWITAGTFEQGEVLDIEQITNEAQVTYESTTMASLQLTAANTWVPN